MSTLWCNKWSKHKPTIHKLGSKYLVVHWNQYTFDSCQNYVRIMLTLASQFFFLTNLAKFQGNMSVQILVQIASAKCIKPTQMCYLVT